MMCLTYVVFNWLSLLSVLVYDVCPVASSLTLLDQCAFETVNTCGMIQNRNDDGDWVRTKSQPGSHDHTLIGQCKGRVNIQYY